VYLLRSPVDFYRRESESFEDGRKGDDLVKNQSGGGWRGKRGNWGGPTHLEISTIWQSNKKKKWSRSIKWDKKKGEGWGMGNRKTQ